MKLLAEEKGVEVYSFDVIYHLIHAMKERMAKLLPPAKQYTYEGRTSLLHICCVLYLAWVYINCLFSALSRAVFLEACAMRILDPTWVGLKHIFVASHAVAFMISWCLKGRGQIYFCLLRISFEF